MLDIKLIRESPEVVRESCEKRGFNLKLLDELIEKDKQWREFNIEVDKLKNQRNIISKEISELKIQGSGAESKLEAAAEIPKQIETIETKTDELKERITWLLMRIPNILHESVPAGTDETDNVEVKRFGELPNFGFEPKSHLELLQDLDLLDSERGAKVSGNGFFYLKEELVLLDLALQRFTIDFMRTKGYKLVEPPFMVNKTALSGTVNITDFEDTIYKIEDENSYLIGSSENSILPMFMSETILISDLPIKLVGVSPCFRKELGSSGKYTKGLFRMHQFNKVEQIIFCKPEDSYKLLDELQKNSEELFELLELPYRVVNTCAGELGDKQAKMYDLEILMGDGVYREEGSNSNCTDYQARRLGIRYREKEGQKPIGFVHILNNTCIATSRAMIAVVEMNQQKDGSIKIPEVLQPYMNGIKEIVKK